MLRDWWKCLFMASIPKRHLRWWLVGGTLAALVVRIAVSVVIMPPDYRYSVEVDARSYVLIAQNLLDTGVFGVPPGVPFMYVPPGYPAFIAASYYIFGLGITGVRIVQALLSSLTCAMVFLIGRQLYSERPRIAIGAMLGLAFCPPLVLYVGFQLTETLYIFLLTAFVLSAIHLLTRPGLANTVVAGVLLGACNMVREELLLFPVAMFVLFYLHNRSVKKTVLVMGSFLLAVLLVIGPWIVRNSIMIGQPVFLTDRTQYVLYKIGLSDYAAETYLDPNRSPDWRTATFLGSMRYAGINQMLDLKAALQDPARYLLTVAVRIEFLWLHPVGMVSLPGIIPQTAYRAVHISMIILALLGCISVIRQRNYPAWVLVGIWGYSFLLHMFTTVSVPRYSLPSLPFVVILACAAAVEQFDRRYGVA
jgi:4-amino-4-deoxy-L-arabinose transferase-like glycosyltransferase